jgi:hypothetical protein|uniref:Uncharacterized protein n=1 Tax=viral metagenome TaxID=1070528 RepID=A0A6C0CLJ6_9ZZZZ
MWQLNKQQNKNLLLFVEKKLQFISNNNKLNGFLIFIFHLLFQIFSIYILFFYPISPLFYFTFLIWILILISNYYFKGCILTKIERYLWKNKQWFGPYYIFCNLKSWSPNKIKNMYICQIIFLITILFIRVLFKI